MKGLKVGGEGETARRRGIALLHAIRLTLDGQPLPVGP